MNRKGRIASLLVLGFVGISAVYTIRSSATVASIDAVNKVKLRREEAAQKRVVLPEPASGIRLQFPRLESQPDWARGIVEIPQRGYVSHAILRGSTSVWKVDSVPTQDYTDWNPFFVYAKSSQDGRPVLGTMVMNMPPDPKWTGQWVAPRAFGRITITSVTAQTGSVYFRNEAGQTGTFDLTAHTWSFTE